MSKSPIEELNKESFNTTINYGRTDIRVVPLSTAEEIVGKAIAVGEARERKRVLEIISETRPEYQRRYSSDANECLDGVERRITEATTEPGHESEIKDTPI